MRDIGGIGRRDKPHQQNYRKKTHDCDNDVVGDAGAEHPYSRLARRRLDILLVRLDESADWDNEEQKPRALHSHSLDS